MTSEATSDALAEACTAWQTDLDHSRRIRAAARVIAGVPHYFQAEFVQRLETAVRGDHATLLHASTLMTNLVKATLRTVDDWRSLVDVPGNGCAAHGIAATDPATGIDAEIERAVTRPGATLNMPLWGFSLDEDTARSNGPRFLLRLQGRFSALPAWVHSNGTGGEQEMIGGGGYRVLGTKQDGDTLVVDLKQLAVPMYAAHDLDRLLADALAGGTAPVTE